MTSLLTRIRAQLHRRARLRAIQQRPFGVNLYGYHSAATGLATVARGFTRALTTAGIPVLPVDVPLWGDQHAPRIPPPDHQRYRINLIQQNADTMRVFVESYGEDILRGCYNIGLCFWELSVLPPQWVDHLKYLDEIWVASEFCREAFSKAVSIPVTRIPVVIDGLEQKAIYSREYFGFGPGVFVFCYMFDFHSFIERKNPIALVEAFRAAFGDSPDALLFFKTSNGGMANPNARALYQAVEGARNIRIEDRILTEEESVSLHNAIDCFVSPHRSEGFGLNLAECMYFEKPVIATRYSANLDFMTDANSYLLDFKLITINHSAGPYTQGSTWADPSPAHLPCLLREVYDNKPGRLAKGRRAAEDIRRQYSVTVVSQAMVGQLGKLRPIGNRPGR
jgi:glycosyltransferase involved in cell wall biosynthesis